MRVLIMSANQRAAELYRLVEPARAIREQGFDVEIVHRSGLSTKVVRGADGKDQTVGVDAEGADVVVIQLPKSEGMLQCIRLLQQQGVAVVVEMDDLMTGVSYGHQGFDALVKKGMGRRGLDCAREADLVTVASTALLEEYAPHGRGAFIPNAVPRWMAELPPAYERTPETLTIGWTGNVHVHPYDLQTVGSGLQQALDQTRGRSRFAVLGQRWDAQQLMGLVDAPTEIPWMVDVDAYRTGLGELFDVGIAPLRGDRFNECKSYLKVMEYSARGIACVRAASPEYERLGLGWRARSARDWAKGLTTLIRDDDRRREQAAAARETVLAKHLTEHTAELWVAAWRQALDNRTRRLRRGA